MITKQLFHIGTAAFLLIHFDKFPAEFFIIYNYSAF